MTWDDETIQKVWEKGTVVTNNDQKVWRKDKCKAWIKRDKYGDRDSTYGWEIDHIDGDSENDDLSNLQPLQWENNVHKGDGILGCKVTSSGSNNVYVQT